jgi:hypothetical protein
MTSKTRPQGPNAQDSMSIGRASESSPINGHFLDGGPGAKKTTLGPNDTVKLTRMTVLCASLIVRRWLRLFQLRRDNGIGPRHAAEKGKQAVDDAVIAPGADAKLTGGSYGNASDTSRNRRPHQRF